MFFIANTAMNVIGESGEALFFCRNRFCWLKLPKLFETRPEDLNHFVVTLAESGARSNSHFFASLSSSTKQSLYIILRQGFEEAGLRCDDVLHQRALLFL